MSQQKDMTGILGKNKYQKTKKQPSYKGIAKVNGEDVEIAGWVKETKDGEKIISLVFSEPYQKPSNKKTSNKKDDGFVDDDEDLPF
jgi:hypothetical protein